MRYDRCEGSDAEVDMQRIDRERAKPNPPRFIGCDSDGQHIQSTISPCHLRYSSFNSSYSSIQLKQRTGYRGVARNLIWVGINGSRRQNNHIKHLR